MSLGDPLYVGQQPGWPAWRHDAARLLPVLTRVYQGVGQLPGRLRAWQAALFPTGLSGLSMIRVGEWRNDRDGPMQVVSGPV